MVTLGYRVLIVSERSGSIHELRLPRLAVWAIVLGVASSSSAAAAGVWKLARIERVPDPSRASAPETNRSPKASVARGAARASTPAEPSGDACAPGMILVSGDYCPSVFHRCKSFKDPEGSALRGVRCAQYEDPARCLSPQRKRVRYCIDRDEYVAKGEALPQNLRTFAEARQACARVGKRLCTESEWTFACEGEAMRPYPYGFARDSSACNADQSGLVAPDGELRDLRAQPGSFARCASAAGVRDLTGNLEEYVAMDSDPERATRKGAYWQPGANHCRAAQPHPDLSYRGVEVGFRCCADAVEPNRG